MIDLLIWIVVAVVIYFLLKWLIDTLSPPEPLNKILNVLLVLGVVIVILQKLLPLAGINLL